MLDHLKVLKALRTTLLSVKVAQTPATTLTATGTGFTRAAGSFITDGMVPGMEVLPAGFTNNDPAVIKTVSALAITTYQANTVESAASGRSLTVGIPSIRSWENTNKKRVQQYWYFDEDYSPGGSYVYGLGSKSFVEHTPMYFAKIEGLDGIGVEALYKMAHAIMTAFPPMLVLQFEGTDIVRVMSEPAPYIGQLVNREEGAPEIVVTIPLIAETSNPI